MKKIMTLGLGNKPYKNKNIRNSPNKKSKKLISFFDYKDINNNINKINNSPSPKHSAGKYIQNKKRTNSFNTPNLQLKKRLSHNKINIFNYRAIRKRSIKMIRRKSQGDSDIYNNNQKILLDLIIKNNNNYNKNKLSVNSFSKENKSENININNINNSILSCSEDSTTNLNIMDDNNINLFYNDSNSIISRFDSDLPMNNSESSRLDSIDKTCDESQKFFLNSNSNSQVIMIVLIWNIKRIKIIVNLIIN